LPLHHEIAGSGPALLLVHNGLCDSRMWDPQWDALAETFTVIRADLRGFGRSPLPGHPWNNADDLAEVLDLAGVESASVVGNSFGGRAALELAARHPDRVERLVLFAASAGGDPDPEVASLNEQEYRLWDAGDVDGLVKANLDGWVQPDIEPATRERIAEMQRTAIELQIADPDAEPEDIEIDPAAITVPVTLVSGGRDYPMFTRIADRLAAELPDGRRIHLEWAGHLPTLERPGEALALLTTSLAR
jgi:pimeloyl-ACP methyl ester carboxylesterase